MVQTLLSGNLLENKVLPVTVSTLARIRLVKPLEIEISMGATKSLVVGILFSIGFLLYSDKEEINIE